MVNDRPALTLKQDSVSRVSAAFEKKIFVFYEITAVQSSGRGGRDKGGRTVF
jgi:hypothetical protein